MMKKIQKYQHTVNRFNTLLKEEKRKNQENKARNNMQIKIKLDKILSSINDLQVFIMLLN